MPTFIHTMKAMLTVVMGLVFLTSVKGVALDIGGVANLKYGCDGKGTPTLRGELGSVNLLDQIVPLQVIYKKDNENGEILPAQWRIPLLESCAYLMDETMCLIYFPDGTMGCYPVGRAGDENQASVTQHGSSMITIVRDGKTFLFKEGHLSKVTNKNHESYSFYTNEREIGILNESGAPILKAAKSNNGAHGQLKIQWQNERDVSPQFAAISYDNVPKTLLQTVNAMGGVSLGVYELQSNQTRITFTPTKYQDALTKVVIDVAELKNGIKNSKQISLLWNEANRLCAIDNLQLKYFDPTDQVRSSWPCICGLDSLGNENVLQIGYCEPAVGVQRYFTPSTVTDQFYTLTPGGFKLRKEVSNGVTTYSAKFDSLGRLIYDTRDGFVRKLRNGKYETKIENSKN